MKYIYYDEDGTHFDSYFKYLETVRDKMPPHVYQFASDYKYYNLDSHSSLHDAWLDYLKIIEPAQGDRKQNRTIEIQARFLAPFHDKRIYLTYKNVIGFELKTPECFETYPGSSFQREGGHGDLYTHEIRIEEDSILVHEIEFFEGSNFVIKCRDIFHSEKDYSYK